MLILRAHGALITAYLAFYQPAVFSPTFVFTFRNTWCHHFLGLCGVIIMLLGFPHWHLGFILPSLLRELLLIRLYFLAFKFLLLSSSTLFSFSLWVFAFLKYSYTAIFGEFVKGAEVNMCIQSGIFN